VLKRVIRLPYIFFPPMIWQTISMHMASMCMRYRRPKLSFTLETIVRHSHQAVITPIAR